MIKREHSATAYDVWRSQEKPVEENTGPSAWQKITDRLKDKKVRGIVFGGVAIFSVTIILLAALSFVYFQRGFFAQDRVFLTMEAPQVMDSNKLTELTFTFHNDNRAALNNSEITVNLGDYFIPAGDQDDFTQVSNTQGVIHVGTISGHEKNSFVLVGYFAGPRESVGTVAGTLRYIPEKTNVRYETNARSTTTITSSPVVIDVESPKEIVSGNLLNIVFKIRNASEGDLSQVKFVVDVPQTFALYNASPLPNYGNTWLIDRIPAQGEVAITVRGSIKAVVGTSQNFTARVVSQNEDDEETEYASIAYAPRMIQSPIIVEQQIGNNENVVFAGQTLLYTVRFFNNSDIPLRDAIVTVNLDSAVLDYENLMLMDKGDFDQENRRIVWKASDVPELKNFGPRASGSVQFSVPVLNSLPINSEKDFHFSTTSIAAIDSQDIPSELRENKVVLSNVLTIPVGAKVVYESGIKYTSGSRQLKVGEKTVYTITPKISNINNDIGDVKVRINLPTHTKFEGTEDKSLAYNERANEIVWTVGNMVHGVGVTSDARTTSFDVSIVPSVDQVRRPAKIVTSQELTGVDEFTGNNITLDLREIISSSSDQVESEPIVSE